MTAATLAETLHESDIDPYDDDICPECGGDCNDDGCYPSCSEYGQFKATDLSEMETILQGHTDDLKLELQRPVPHRVWLSRMTVADGMPYDNQVTVEELVGGRWERVAQYQG